jgi:hypothetical protein
MRVEVFLIFSFLIALCATKNVSYDTRDDQEALCGVSIHGSEITKSGSEISKGAYPW